MVKGLHKVKEGKLRNNDTVSSWIKETSVFVFVPSKEVPLVVNEFYWTFVASFFVWVVNFVATGIVKSVLVPSSFPFDVCREFVGWSGIYVVSSSCDLSQRSCLKDKPVAIQDGSE